MRSAAAADSCSGMAVGTGLLTSSCFGEAPNFYNKKMVVQNGYALPG